MFLVFSIATSNGFEVNKQKAGVSIHNYIEVFKAHVYMVGMG